MASSKPADGAELMIYPSHDKYVQSRMVPFVAMQARLRAFFSMGRPVLVLCGYSFGDEHINQIIEDGLRANRGAHCIALQYGDLASCGPGVQIAQRNVNLTLMARNGAVAKCSEASHLQMDGEPVEPNLGDFHHFADMLFNEHVRELSLIKRGQST